MRKETFTFSEFSEEVNYQEFCSLDFNNLNEGVLSSLSASLKRKVDFVKMIASETKKSLNEIVNLFKNRTIFKFFTSIKWSFDKLLKLLKDGYKSYQNLLKVVSEYLANNKVIKWTDQQLKKLDEFLKKHPKTKKIAGIGVAALLVYIWFHVSFTGDVSVDFSMDSLIDALHGNFSLSDIFGGANGIMIIGLLIGGSFGVSFPWPSRAKTQFIVSIIGTLLLKFKN